jgi:DNA-binding transcriptional MerR regulator
MEQAKTVYTIRQAAQTFGLPEFALRNWCKAGQVQHLKSGNRVYLTAQAVEQFLQKGDTAHESAKNYALRR